MDREFFYRPDRAWVGDVIPYYEDGTFKLFYLHGWRENAREGLPRGWFLVETDDFCDFRERGPCGIEGGTGHILKAGGVYHMFYCVFPEGRQLVCHAVSEDLSNWTPIPEDTFGADGDIYEPSDWRDPFVFRNEEAGEYWMLVAAMAKGHASKRKGCTGLLASKDLKRWEYREPLYAPGIHVGAHECPDLFRIGEWWYLVYSSYTERFATFYRMSRSPGGPWMTPKEDTFDGRAFYAAKTASDGADRYLFGWNPTKRDDLFGWNPPSAPGHDYDTWDWGGNLVVHHIVQRADGTLAVKAPEPVDRLFGTRMPLAWAPATGAWSVDAQRDAVACRSPYALSALTSERELPLRCKLSAEITFSAPTQGAGFFIRTGEGLDTGYTVRLEPQRGRMTFRGSIMQTEEGGKTFPYELELERPADLQPDVPHRLNVFIDDTICEIYLDDQIAMSARMYDTRSGKLGLFVSQGEASFERIRVETVTARQGE